MINKLEWNGFICFFRSADYGYSRMVAHNTTHLEVAQVSDDQVSNFGNFKLSE